MVKIYDPAEKATRLVNEAAPIEAKECRAYAGDDFNRSWRSSALT